MTTTPQTVRPLRREWVIGGETYEQTPFGLDRTALLLEYVGDLLDRASADPRVTASLQELQKNADDYRAIGGVLAALLKAAPASLVRIVALCLDVHESPERAAAVARACTPSQALGIVDAMVEQNDLAALWKDFLALQARIGGLLSPER